MNRVAIESALSAVESKLDAMSAALIAGDALALEAQSAEFRRMAGEFAQTLTPVAQNFKSDAAFLARVENVSSHLAMQRENILRRQVTVDRALAAVLPASVNADTYSAPTPVGGAGQAGAARIYTAHAR